MRIDIFGKFLFSSDTLHYIIIIDKRLVINTNSSHLPPPPPPPHSDIQSSFSTARDFTNLLCNIEPILIQ